MPKYILNDPSSFETTKLGGDTLFVSRNNIISRHSKSPKIPIDKTTSPPSSVFQLIRAQWLSLSPAFKASWTAYKNFMSLKKTGYNTFIKNNMQKQFAYGVNPAYVLNITTPGMIPISPPGFSASYCSVRDRIFFEWSDPYGPDIYISSAYKNIHPYSSNGMLPLTIVGGAISSDLSYLATRDFLVNSSRVLVTIRACNFRGEVSPWADPVIISLPDPPVCDWHAHDRSGYSPLLVTFHNESTGVINGYFWEFGDGSTSTEVNPTHIYSGPSQYFTPKLTVYGCAGISRSKSRGAYIHIFFSSSWDTVIFICDQLNFRIIKRSLTDFSFLDKYGSEGSGNNELNGPSCVCADNTYIYITDCWNNRIVKRKKSDLSYVSKIGSLGSGEDEFNSPEGITCDDHYLYICDYSNSRIVKRWKVDLVYVSELNSFPAGPGHFDIPLRIAVDDAYIYFSDPDLNQILIYNKNDLSFVYAIPSSILTPPLYLSAGIVFVDTCYIWTTANYNDFLAIVVIDKITRSLVACYQTDLAASTAFYGGLFLNSSFLWISDTANNHVYKFSRSPFSLLDSYGSTGSGDDQYDDIMGIGGGTPFSTS